MRPSAGELEIILADIKKALAAKLWYAALVVALSLPDICSLLEMPPEQMRSKRKKYAAWFDDYVSRHFKDFTGDDCYSLRGGVVHHGHFGHKNARYDRIAFRLPIPGGPKIGQMLSVDCGGFEGSTISFGLDDFCERVTNGVREWYQAKSADPLVQANLPSLVRYRTELDGHALGFPMIA